MSRKSCAGGALASATKALKSTIRCRFDLPYCPVSRVSFPTRGQGPGPDRMAKSMARVTVRIIEIICFTASRMSSDNICARRSHEGTSSERLNSIKHTSSMVMENCPLKPTAFEQTRENTIRIYKHRSRLRQCSQEDLFDADVP